MSGERRRTIDDRAPSRDSISPGALVPSCHSPKGACRLVNEASRDSVPSGSRVSPTCQDSYTPVGSLVAVPCSEKAAVFSPLVPPSGEGNDTGGAAAALLQIRAGRSASLVTRGSVWSAVTAIDVVGRALTQAGIRPADGCISQVSRPTSHTT